MSTGKYIHHRVLHLLHRYAHIPSTLVINKVDLVSKRSNLLELAEILTDGMVDGSPIQTKRKLHYGLLGNLPQHAETPSTDFRIHQIGAPLSGDAEKDERWQKLYK